MGKSSEVTDLERKLRKRVNSNRIILRVNLNEVQSELSGVCAGEAAWTVLRKLFPKEKRKDKTKAESFLPQSLPTGCVFVLLDGLDEVCPRYQKTMLILLHILQPSDDLTDLHVVVTTRPHLREPVESVLNLESWSLLPLSVEQQNEFMEKKLSSQKSAALSNIRRNVPIYLEGLLSNPLMLFMFTEILQSEATFNTSNLNVFDFYSRFIEEKHKLQLVQKEGMRDEDSSTETRLESVLAGNLPFYSHFAWTQLISDKKSVSIAFTESIGNVAWDPSVKKMPSVRKELLSFGLLIEGPGNDRKLVLKHRSFGEFFYARLLLAEDEEDLPQVVRDTLFGFVYGRNGVLGNVETFLTASLSKRRLQRESHMSLSPTWLFVHDELEERCYLLQNFMKGQLFPLLAKDVLLSFVRGDPRDLWGAFQVLVEGRSRDAFRRLFEWMGGENEEWTRWDLLKINDFLEPAPARLAVAIALTFGGQVLLSAEEVKRAVNSLDHRLVYIVASIQTEKNKWDFVEGLLSEGRSQLRNLMKTINDDDLSKIIKDISTAQKLVGNLSREELLSLVTTEETRVSDVVGRVPREVGVVLGEEFVPCGINLRKLRGKFGKYEGKNVFEMNENGAEFGLDGLWEELLKEVGKERVRGQVADALREAIGNLGKESWGPMEEMELQVRKRKSSCSSQQAQVSKELVGVVEWVVGGCGESAWNSGSSSSRKTLQFLVRYSPNPHVHLPSMLTQRDAKLSNEFYMLAVLKSLILSSAHHDDLCFSQLGDFLKENLPKIPVGNPSENWTPIAQILSKAKKEEIRTAAGLHTHHPGGFLTSEISVGQVFISLTKDSSAEIVGKKSWDVVVADVIEFTRCCDIPETLEELRRKFVSPEEQMELRRILRSKEVAFKWQFRWSSSFGGCGENCDFCGLGHLLAFFFSVFGLNLQWMEVEVGDRVGVAYTWILLRKLPVEIATALEGNPQWRNLLPEFGQLVQKSLGLGLIGSVGELAVEFTYRTEAEWERLLLLIGGTEKEEEELLQQDTKAEFIRSAVAAPLIRVLLGKFGVEGTKKRVTRELWATINSGVGYPDDSVGSLGSLLHSAIQLGEEKEVRRRAWPGLLRWRNPEGRTALDIAKERLQEKLEDPIRLLLEELTMR